MNYRNDKGLICMDLWSNNDIKEGNQVIKYNDNVLVKHWKDKRTKDKEQAKNREKYKKIKRLRVNVDSQITRKQVKEDKAEEEELRRQKRSKVKRTSLNKNF